MHRDTPKQFRSLIMSTAVRGRCATWRGILAKTLSNCPGKATPSSLIKLNRPPAGYKPVSAGHPIRFYKKSQSEDICYTSRCWEKVPQLPHLGRSARQLTSTSSFQVASGHANIQKRLHSYLTWVVRVDI